jgi:hypothetical protein
MTSWLPTVGTFLKYYRHQPINEKVNSKFRLMLDMN